MKYGNLHLHSNHSDAGFRPAHLVCLAKSLGYSAIALTDHETISGLPELFEFAKAEGLEPMSGVEFYGDHQGHHPHLVGLDFDPAHPAIRELSQRCTQWRNEHSRAQFEAIVELGGIRHMSWMDVQRCNPITRWYAADQIFHALDIMGIVPLHRCGEFRKKYFHNEEVEKIKLRTPTAKEVIGAIREAGGVAVLAHPSAYMFEGDFIPQLVSYGLNGIETCHPDLGEREVKLAYHAAVEYQLYCSGGTDHTGPMSACYGINAIPAYHGVTLDEFQAIKERRLG